MIGLMRAHIGDRVIVPWRMHRNGTDVIGGWREGRVVATRGRDRVIVACSGWEQGYPAREVKPYPRHHSEWPHSYYRR
jgi:hypothetical protein